MSTDVITPSVQPSVNVTGLHVPKQGQTAKAGEMVDALQQLLDNDAALLAMAGAGLKVTAVPLHFDDAPGAQVIYVPLQPVGAVLGVQGAAGRVSGHIGVPPDTRGFYEPYPAGCVFDVSLGDYGGKVILDRPALYAHQSEIMMLRFSLNNPDQQNAAGYDFTLYVVGLAPWADDSIPT